MAYAGYMGRLVSGPGDGGGATTGDVAALVAAVVLPSIEPFGPDNPGLAGLPDYTRHPVPVPEPPSRVSVARGVQDATMSALAAVKCLEDRTAALKAALVARLLAASAVEATALALDPWQAGIAESSATAEIAATLCIPQGAATALAHHAAGLSGHGALREALDAGVLSWRHACIVLDECQTLAETPGTTGADVRAFETRLLRYAPGSTAAGFASKARREREGTHPETLTTRVRQAIATRDMVLEPGKDGMSWLTLHLPAHSAKGIWTHCTRTARAQQGPHEHRTLTQLLADTAAALLLGQHPLPNTAGNSTGRTGDASGGAGRTGGASGSGNGRGHPAGTVYPDGLVGPDGAGDGGAGDGGPGGRYVPAWIKRPPGTAPSGAGVGGGGAGVGNGAVSGTVAEDGDGFAGVRLVDIVPNWAHGPRHPIIGPLTEKADAAAETWAGMAENIPVTGSVLPDTPHQAGHGTHAGTHAGTGGHSHSDAGGDFGGDSGGRHGGGAGVPGGVPAGVPGGFPGPGEVPATGGLLPDGSGFVDGIVDGIPEDPVQEYLDQLKATREGAAITDPPAPAAEVIVTVPVLGLLGLTNEPAQLAGHGPIPEEIARKLLGKAGTFLRVLTDPVTGTALKDLPPQRYRLRDAEKTLLHALAETCSFPNCTTPALDTEIDHLTPWAQGGTTTRSTTRGLCRRHHALKHFRDDKDRHGRHRQDLDPDRTGIKLRGWKPVATADGRIGWTSPSGHWHPPQERHTPTPAYPKWLKKRIDTALNPDHGPTTTKAATTNPAPTATSETGHHEPGHHEPGPAGDL